MNEQELAALRAKNQELEKQITQHQAEAEALKAKNENTALVDAEIRAKSAELEAGKAKAEAAELKAKNDALIAADTARRTADADKAIGEAVARGAIAAKDEATKNRWRSLIIADPANTALLASHAGNPALGGRVTPSVQVVGVGVREAIDAYEALRARQATATTVDQKLGLAREAGAIWATDLRRNEAFLDMPIAAANSLGTAVGTLVTQRVLELLKIQLPALNRVSSDFSDQQVKYGQTVYSRYVTPPTVGTYNTSTGYAQTDLTNTDVTVTINRHKYTSSNFGANTLSGTVRNLFEENAPASAYAIAKEMVDYAYTLILAATYTNTVITAAQADFSRNTVIRAGVALNKLGVPFGAQNRTLLLNSDYFGQLAQDPAIVSLAAFQRPQIIEGATLPDVHGFAVIDAPNLPDNSENLVGFGFSRSALMIASRLPIDYTTVLPGANFGNVQVVTNPDNGMSVMQVEYVDHTLGVAAQRRAWMYGASAAQVAAGQRITSA